jgi:hypothetical protein
MNLFPRIELLMMAFVRVTGHEFGRMFKQIPQTTLPYT